MQDSLQGTMAEDTFIREVDEQMRQDRARELWSKYGKIIIALAVAIVLATAGTVAWRSYNDSVAAGFGDSFADAIALSNDGKHDEAIAKLQEIAGAGSGQYPALAELRIAGELAGSGDKKGAMARFDTIAADSDFNQVFRDLAKLRAGLLAVDLEDYSSVEARLTTLAAAGGAYRHSAREALGIAALKAGNDQKALEWFKSIVDDVNSVAGVRQRAQTMLNLLAGKGVVSQG
jgi:hypothetical protein